ncbi:calcium/calmodulin-dependent protein kinase II inhibitor 1b [Neoarius graeffei]|uniref:calcium/calmodulin-dependent protein kinase II inhibitor 1b n=1 Tax=Neoarius graeffei TaxID=443677 RepID=UPI00298CA1B1|nr:calcium/calmodulin-dependent protein kinase II inhibitor 1b [Neoarius graeffei]XP_060792771.1 calcium/calmodulin-dependent protein kinase II inhibitor 1b [Neoarius graeffei]
MSQVLPYEETISRYGNDGDEEQMSLTCRLHNTNNFYSSTQNKRAPKLGQIGRSKRVVIDDDRIDEVLQNTTEKSPAKV